MKEDNNKKREGVMSFRDCLIYAREKTSDPVVKHKITETLARRKITIWEDLPEDGDTINLLILYKIEILRLRTTVNFLRAKEPQMYNGLKAKIARLERKLQSGRDRPVQEPDHPSKNQV